MSISFNRYVNITSGLGAGTAVAQRDLILRLISTNTLLPTNGFIEFTSLVSVGDFFGTSSPEYLRAQFVFGFTSKNITRARSISFARWADTNQAPRIIGAPVRSTLTQFQQVTNGDLTITLGDVTQAVTGIDISASTSLADVANDITTAIRASVADSQFDTATIAYDPVLRRYILTGGAEEVAGVAVTATDPTLLGLLGWATGVLLSPGVLAQTVTAVLSDSTRASNNFGTFAFVPTLTVDQIVEAATWNNTNNLLFVFATQVTPTNAQTISDSIINFAGSEMVLNTPELSNEYPELLPAAIAAATDYTRQNVNQNYMFYSSTLTPTVTDDTDANLYDGLRVNYYGQTQTAGQKLSFYQRGFLTGSGTAPVNRNVFTNEQWLKDFAGSQILSTLLNVNLPASAEGRSRLLNVLRNTIIDRAQFNGVISPGRTLTTQDIINITELSGDPEAYFQVQTSGFWVDASVISEVRNGVTEFVAQYTLIYATAQNIRRADGSHVLF